MGKASLKQVLRNFLQTFDEMEQSRDGPEHEDRYLNEFCSLKELTEQLKHDPDPGFSCSEGLKEVNRRKNRYKDILPYDYTRVVIEEYPGVPGSDYINANYVKGSTGSTCAYIASQGPLPNTLVDFWRMIWECETTVIVMACNESESGKYKCESYWPQSPDEEQQYGNITVKLVKWRNVCPDFLVRTLEIRQDSIVRTVIQFHYGSWPDHGVPAAVTPILELVRLMRDVQATETRAILVHCSAGCGRTGTICSIDYVWALLRAGKLDSDFSLYRIIYEMRKQRIAMVQTLEQYMLCYKAIAVLFEQQLKIIDAHTYENLDEDGEPLILRSLSMQSNSSSSDLLINSDEDEEGDPSCGQTASVKTYSSSNAATISSSSGWSGGNRLDKNSIDSGIIIVNPGTIVTQGMTGVPGDSNQITDQVRRQKHEERGVTGNKEDQHVLPVMGKEEDVIEEGLGERKQQQHQRLHQQQVNQGLHQRLPHPNLQDGSAVSDCLRMRRAPSLDSLMSCSAAASSAAAAANCQLLHHPHHQRQHSHPHPPHHQHEHHQQQQQQPVHQFPPSSSSASEGLVRPEKLVGKATVIRRSSIAKLKAMFETLSSGEDNNNNNNNHNNCSSHHHHYHQRDRSSRRVRLQRSQSTREQGSSHDTEHHHNYHHSHSQISSCKILAAAHSYHQRQRSATSSSTLTGLSSPMDISHEAAAVAAQAFSLKLDSDQHQPDQGKRGGDSDGSGNSGQVVSHTFRSISTGNNNNNTGSSQASASSSPSTDQSVSDPASDCVEQPVSATKSPGQSHESESSETPDPVNKRTMRETGAVPKKSSLKVSKSGRTSANAPPKPPRTYQYGSAGGSSPASDKEQRGRIIARLSTPNGNASSQVDPQQQQREQSHQQQITSDKEQEQSMAAMQQHHNRLNRHHLSAPILPNHHHAHISGQHDASQPQPQAQPHHPSPLHVSMDLIHQHQQSLQQHHQQAIAAGLHPVPPAHHMIQKPEAIYQTLVPRQMVHRPNPQMPPHPGPYFHPAQYHQQQQHAQPIYGMIGMRREYHHLSVPSLFPHPSQPLSLSLTPQPGILHPHHNHHHHPLHHQQQHLPLQPLKPVMPGSGRITNIPGLSQAQISYFHQQQQQQQHHLHQIYQNQASPSASNNHPHAASNNNRIISNHNHYRSNGGHNNNHSNDHEASTPTYEDIYDVIPAALQKKRPILVEKETRPPVTYVRPQPNPQLQQNNPPAMDNVVAGKEKEKDNKSAKHASSSSSKIQSSSSSNKSTASTSSTPGNKLKSSHSTSQLAVVGGSKNKNNNKDNNKNKDPSSSTSTSSSSKKSFSLSIFFGGSSSNKNKSGSSSSKDPSTDLHHNHIISNNNNNTQHHKSQDRKTKKSHSLHSSVQNLSSQISAIPAATASSSAGAPTGSSSGFSGSSKVIFSRPPHSHRFSPPAQWTQV